MVNVFFFFFFKEKPGKVAGEGVRKGRVGDLELVKQY